ncbi:MAG: hypothetical protein SX243_08960 [Acidobacteriota bacterium]|nr:hypothetical protein [Acidobacteriota bacterium]
MSSSSRYFFGSLTRIAPFQHEPFEVQEIDRSQWATGDYVVAEVLSRSRDLGRVELPNGRHAEVQEGDLVVGAWGHRSATLEAVGSWTAIGEDGRFQGLTSAGLFGKATSTSRLLPPLVTLGYRGHVTVDGRPRRMADYVAPAPAVELTAPVVLIIGTSMTSGKTTAGKILIHMLVEQGVRVAGVKLTGAGRYRDILSMDDAGAAAIFDFVDVGLPSTVCPEEEFKPLQEQLLARVAAAEPDVVVVEAGASPLEPYNGAAAVERLSPLVRCTVLCAADPYAAFGVREAFPVPTDLVSGLATSTSAAIDLVGKLTGLPAINVLDRASHPELRRFLLDRLQL